MSLVNREMGAVVSALLNLATSKPGLRYCLEQSGAPISRSARIGVLSDIPAGQSRVGVVSVHNRSAATVTQAGGLNGLPAFSYLAQRQAGEPGVTQRHSGLKRLPASVGGAR